MFPIEQVADYEFQGQHMSIHRYGCDWLFIVQDTSTGQCKGTLCTCFQQASDLMDCVIEKTKIWIN